MTKIYSKIDPYILLHIIHRKDDFKEERNDLVEPDNFLQCAALNMSDGKTFKPHEHLCQEVLPREQWAQESWVVLSGSVRAILYDIDQKIIAMPILNAGDCSITLIGGHTYEVIKAAKVLEFKSGPYYGQEKDKVFI